MVLYAAIKTHQGPAGDHIEFDGWPDGQAGPVGAQTLIRLSNGRPREPLLRVTLEPALDRLSATAARGSLHYSRLADATLRPLPALAEVSFARGDTYIGLTPPAGLAEPPAIARFLHMRDDFNAERLAEGVLDFLAQESGASDFPLDVSVIVVEAR